RPLNSSACLPRSPQGDRYSPKEHEKSPNDTYQFPSVDSSNSNRRPSIVSTGYKRRPSITSNAPRQLRSFSISSNDITLPIPEVKKSPDSPRLPSSQTSFRRPSIGGQQEEYPYHINIKPNVNTNVEDLLSSIDFTSSEKRFTVVGLGYECHVFNEIAEMWKLVVDSHQKRGKNVEEDATILDLLGDSIDRPEPIWIDIQKPTEKDMNEIERLFSLHPLTTEDCIKNDTGEKWELFEDYMFVVFTTQVDNKENSFALTQFNIIVFENLVVTIHEKPVKALDLLIKRIGTEFEVDVDEGQNVPRQFPQSVSLTQPITTGIVNPQHLRLLPELQSATAYKYDVNRSLTKKIGTPMTGSYSFDYDTNPEMTEMNIKRRKTTIPGPDWILYAFLDATVDVRIPYVDSLLQDVENLDELVFMLCCDEHDDLLKRIGMIKKNIVNMRRLLYPKQKMTSYLVSQELKFVSDIIKVYLRDVLDHLAICIDKLELARENLMHTHSNYLTKVQIEIAQASSRTDDFMNRITILAAILAPLTLVSGLWGMNVRVPGGTSEGLGWFFGIVSAMFCMTLLIMIFLRRKLVTIKVDEKDEQQNQEG
ncbi:hypothetical protein AKO1_004877, partial [Acrasis kona]